MWSVGLATFTHPWRLTINLQFNRVKETLGLQPDKAAVAVGFLQVFITVQVHTGGALQKPFTTNGLFVVQEASKIRNTVEGLHVIAMPRALPTLLSKQTLFIKTCP